jgi:hypothetical protein
LSCLGSFLNNPSAQGVNSGLNASVGQTSFTPSQFSATSHNPALSLHCAVDLASDGHACPAVPVQKSVMSQSPTESLQTCVIGSTVSAGHAAESPVHVSSGSHVSPDPALQTVPIILKL